MNREERKQLFECLKGLEPLNGSNLRTLFYLLTKQHYSDPKNYGYLEDQLSCFVNTDDKATSTLNILLSQEYDINSASVRPAVFVGLETPFNFKKVDLNSQQSQLSDNSGFNSAHIVVTSVSFIHVAATIDQALLLADCTTSFFVGIKAHLRDSIGLNSFEPVNISAPALIEKSPEKFFRVDSIFSLGFNYSVRTNIESHRIKNFALEFAAD
jgi:hypothetical protein